MRFGPDKGNSGAIIGWGLGLDKGIWLSWRHWRRWSMITRCRVRHGYLALSLLTMRW